MRTLAKLGLGIAVLLAAPARAAPPDVQRIVEHVENLYRSATAEALVEVQIVTSDWRRTLDARVWSAGRDRVLVRVLSPPKEAGTVTVRNGRNIWQYYPRVDKTVKIPDSLLSGSWMGSHLAYDDLLQESSLTRDYDAALMAERQAAGTELVDVRLTPKRGAPVVWGRVELTVRRRDALPLEERFYDPHGALTRTVALSDVRTVGGRAVPTRLTLQPHDNPTESTTLIYRALQFDAPIDDDTFSLRSLKR